LLSLTPLSNILMGWQGSGGLGAATIGTYWFFGGLLMIIGALLEFVLGNTFPFVVFGSFGSFWLTFGATLTPQFYASIAYLPDDPTASAADPVFMSSFAFFQVYMGVLCTVYCIISVRTNLVFFLIFLLLIPAFGCLSAYFFGHGANPTLLTAAGALTFIICLLGWYLFFVQLLAAVDFPLNLPVGDLSQYVRGASEKKQA